MDPRVVTGTGGVAERLKAPVAKTKLAPSSSPALTRIRTLTGTWRHDRILTSLTRALLSRRERLVMADCVQPRTAFEAMQEAAAIGHRG